MALNLNANLLKALSSLVVLVLVSASSVTFGAGSAFANDGNPEPNAEQSLTPSAAVRSGIIPQAAASEYDTYLDKTVTFCGQKWDVIGLNPTGGTASGVFDSIKRNGATDIAPADNSALLLLHNDPNGTWSGSSAYPSELATTFDEEGTSNTYSDSNLKTKMEGLAGKCGDALE